MCKVKFWTIGRYEIIYKNNKIKNNITKIILKDEFKKAISKLNDFSHCIIFTKCNDKIQYFGRQIYEICESKGEILVYEKLEGDIIDIKPYIPCVERINQFKIDKFNEGVYFKGEPIGEYVFFNNSKGIKLKESKYLKKNNINIVLDKLKQIEYLRIIWWCNKFDTKEFRSNCLCKPPHKGAPISGVFATRSPRRPNPIACTIVKVQFVDKNNNFLEISGFDGFENSPILEIIPYRDACTSQNIRVPLWVKSLSNHKVFLCTTEITKGKNEGEL